MRSRTSQERGRWRGSEELQSDHTCQLRAHEKSHVTGERQVERERGTAVRSHLSIESP